MYRRGCDGIREKWGNGAHVDEPRVYMCEEAPARANGAVCMRPRATHVCDVCVLYMYARVRMDAWCQGLRVSRGERAVVRKMMCGACGKLLGVFSSARCGLRIAEVRWRTYRYRRF